MAVLISTTCWLVRPLACSIAGTLGAGETSCVGEVSLVLGDPEVIGSTAGDSACGVVSVRNEVGAMKEDPTLRGAGVNAADVAGDGSRPSTTGAVEIRRDAPALKPPVGAPLRSSASNSSSGASRH